MENARIPFAKLEPVGLACSKMVSHARNQLEHNKDVRANYIDTEGAIHLTIAGAPLRGRELGWNIGTSATGLDSTTTSDVVVGMHDDPRAEQIKASSFKLYIKASSSLVMFKALENGARLEIFIPATQTWRTIQEGDSIAAFADSMEIRLGGDKVFRYKSLLVNNPDSVARFNAQVETRIPDSRENYHLMGFFPNSESVVFLEPMIVMSTPTIGGGSFASQHTGFDIMTGELRAVKNQLTSDDSKAEFLAEYDIQYETKDIAGVLTPLKLFCECGKHPSVCQHHHQHIYIVTELQMCSLGQFSRERWRDLTESQIRDMFLQVLKAIAAIHEKGIMHRDISINNILIATLFPPTTNICDFGKATKDKWSTYKYIGPRGTVAPGVDGVRYYSREIDLWAWAIAMATILVVVINPDFPGRTETTSPELQHYEARLWLGINNKIMKTPEDVEHLVARLRELEDHVTDDFRWEFLEQAIDMLTGIFKFHRKERLTVAGALDHLYWTCDLPDSESDEDDEDGKDSQDDEGEASVVDQLHPGFAEAEAERTPMAENATDSKPHASTPASNDELNGKGKGKAAVQQEEAAETPSEQVARSQVDASYQMAMELAGDSFDHQQAILDEAHRQATQSRLLQVPQVGTSSQLVAALHAGAHRGEAHSLEDHQPDAEEDGEESSGSLPPDIADTPASELTGNDETPGDVLAEPENQRAAKRRLDPAGSVASRATKAPKRISGGKKH